MPHQLVDTRVRVRFHADDLVVTAVDPTLEGHGPGCGPVEITPHATGAAELEFLAFGPGAASWLAEAATGARRV